MCKESFVWVLVDFAIWLVNSVLNLRDGKGNLKRTVINATGQELYWGLLKPLGLVHASYGFPKG